MVVGYAYPYAATRRGPASRTRGADAADGNVWALTRLGDRRDWMPEGMVEITPRPVMLTLGRQTGFDRLTGTARTNLV